MSEKPLFLFFTAGANDYAASLKKVKRVLPLESITKTPLLKEFFDGVFKYEDKVVPLLNLSRMHGGMGEKTVPEPLILVYQLDQELAGLIIDNVHRVENLELSSMVSFDGSLAGVDKKIVIGKSEYLLFDASLRDFH